MGYGMALSADLGVQLLSCSGELSENRDADYNRVNFHTMEYVSDHPLSED